MYAEVYAEFYPYANVFVYIYVYTLICENVSLVSCMLGLCGLIFPKHPRAHGDGWGRRLQVCAALPGRTSCATDSMLGTGTCPCNVPYGLNDP